MCLHVSPFVGPVNCSAGTMDTWRYSGHDGKGRQLSEGGSLKEWAKRELMLSPRHLWSVGVFGWTWSHPGLFLGSLFVCGNFFFMIKYSLNM